MTRFLLFPLCCCTWQNWEPLRNELLFTVRHPIVSSIHAKQEQKVPKVDRIIQNHHVCILSDCQYCLLGLFELHFLFNVTASDLLCVSCIISRLVITVTDDQRSLAFYLLSFILLWAPLSQSSASSWIHPLHPLLHHQVSSCPLSLHP